MASPHFGSAMWSYTCLSTGAIFWMTRPATIIRSAWRGVAENRSMPNRAMAHRPPPTCIISMAQQARPKVAGHREFLRCVLMTLATVVSRNPLGICSSRPMYALLVPLEPAATPDIGVRDEHGHDEQNHLDEEEDR